VHSSEVEDNVSEVEDNVRPGLAAPTSSSGDIAAVNGRRQGRLALWWGLSCTVHLALLVGVGWWSQTVIDTPQTAAVRVAFIPALATRLEPSPSGEAALPPSRPPERRTPEAVAVVPAPPTPAPLPQVTQQPLLPPLSQPERAAKLATPESRTPEFLEVAPEAPPRREPRPAPKPPRVARADRVTPTQTPPTAALPSAPRPPSTAPARELPQRHGPAATYDDAAQAAPPTPGPPAKEATTQQATLPRSTGVRYGQNPTPAYPTEARRRGWEGTVLLRVEILESGRPERVTIKQSSGHNVLDEAASGAVGRWTFIPAQQDGKPVRSVAEVPIVFSLRTQR
jgi:protein TonB